ncbi:hypothetical protein [Burkholderia pseudomultivorans]|uniref:hypothetical protein n=1 Tax=Burkholderia pseudomultivorans TaxID=1207504 RepID=UPI001E3BFA14|nr:hypothetical protein [Burkholderia pseudomultivorans]
MRAIFRRNIEMIHRFEPFAAAACAHARNFARRKIAEPVSIRIFDILAKNAILQHLIAGNTGNYPNRARPSGTIR